MNERIDFLTQENERYNFARKHDFMYKRPQDFKDCITIHWKHRKRKNKLFIDYDRIDRYCDIMFKLFKKYNLHNIDNFYLDSDYKLSKIGIYSFTSWHKVWAIPDDYQEIQECVKSMLPEWAEVRVKESKSLFGLK